MTKSDRAKNEKVIRVRFYVSELRFLEWVLFFFVEDMKAFERQLRIAEGDAYRKRDLFRLSAGTKAHRDFLDARRLYNDLRVCGFWHYSYHARSLLRRIRSLYDGGHVHSDPIHLEDLPFEI